MTNDDRKKAEKAAHIAGVKATGEASGPLTSISPAVNTTATEVIETPLEVKPDMSGMIDGDIVDSGLEHTEITIEQAREAALIVEATRLAKMAHIRKLQAELAEMNKGE